MPAIASFDRHVRLTFASGSHADFHWLWLRHQDPLERHPTTGERTLNPALLDLDVSPVSVRLEREALVVRWPGADLESRYALGWLEEHAYARARVAPAPGASLADLEVPLRGGRLPEDFLARLDRDGALIGRGGGASPEATEALIAQVEGAGLSVIGTHFGRIEDLRTDNTTNQNTDQLGYTDAAIDLHTDQPFLPRPPRYQLLHAIRAAESGGESLLADGDRIARALATEDAEAYRVLTSTKLRFHRKQKAFERVEIRPLLSRREDGSHEVRSSYFTFAPFDFPFDELEGVYRALRRFESLARSPEFFRRFLLGPGDLVLYDNQRMLHGRAGFRGGRWVRGVYFDREEAR
jgi:gamma-butyrobetaine dioxygenase